ncbi:MAG TPA: hypothetical protein PLO62_08095, partial [Candidatus Hydrogenedentes bacterium]|nr:hypothetical protein [Candidatus Hydrogenedentota bacterium]
LETGLPHHQPEPEPVVDGMLVGMPVAIFPRPRLSAFSEVVPVNRRLVEDRRVEQGPEPFRGLDGDGGGGASIFRLRVEPAI